MVLAKNVGIKILIFVPFFLKNGFKNMRFSALRVHGCIFSVAHEQTLIFHLEFISGIRFLKNPFFNKKMVSFRVFKFFYIKIFYFIFQFRYCWKLYQCVGKEVTKNNEWKFWNFLTIFKVFRPKKTEKLLKISKSIKSVSFPWIQKILGG